jgi:superfamily II DNA/RNA helicase
LAKIKKGADIVVATPGRLQKHREKGHLFLSRVMCLVLDEADALVSTDFGLDAAEIVEALTSRDKSEKRSMRRGPYPEKCLFTVVSATGKSHRLEKLMTKHMPGIVHIHEDPQKRRAQRNEIFVLSPAREKYQTLASVLKSMKSPSMASAAASARQQQQRRVEPTLVFCNSVASCRSAEHLLREQGYGSVGKFLLYLCSSFILSDNF